MNEQRACWNSSCTESAALSPRAFIHYSIDSTLFLTQSKTDCKRGRRENFQLAIDASGGEAEKTKRSACVSEGRRPRRPQASSPAFAVRRTNDSKGEIPYCEEDNAPWMAPALERHAGTRKILFRRNARSNNRIAAVPCRPHSNPEGVTFL